MLEFKSIPFECKADVDKRLVKGYASVFNVVDHHGDLIEKGAFAGTIKRKFDDQPEGRSKIKFMSGHIHPVGLPTKILEDEKGLYVENRVSKTEKGDELLELVRDNVMDEMSIGFKSLQVLRVDRESEEAAGRENLRRILKEIELYETSGVIWGANDKTSIEAMKSLTFVDQAADQLKRGEPLSASQLDGLDRVVKSLGELITAYRKADDPAPEPPQIPDTKGSQDELEAVLRSWQNEVDAFTKTANT